MEAVDRGSAREQLVAPEVTLSEPEHARITGATLACSGEPEMRWTAYSAGDRSDGWEPPAERRTLLLLVSGGPFRVDAGGQSVILGERGDYVMLGLGDTYRWKASSAATILSIR